MRTSVTKIRLAGVALLLVVVAAIYLAITAINGVPAYPYKTVSVTFPTASNLVGHDDVRVHGARIGQVLTTKYNDQTKQTTVKLQLQDGHPVYKNATASIGAISALGAEFVDLNPGDASSGSLPDHHIAPNHTSTAIEIDDVLSIFGPKQANAAAAGVQTLGQAFTGQQGNIRSIFQSYPSLLPNMGTTTKTLTDPQAGLIPLIAQSNALTSAFQGRQQQLAQLLGNMNTTFAALDTQNGQALENTINDAAPVLPQLTPALNDLSQAAGTTATAVDNLKPGLAALGSATPNLRAALRESVSPLQKVPSVSRQAVPAVTNLTRTMSVIQTSQPAVPFLAKLMNQAQPLLAYLEPYKQDMVNMWNVSTSILGDGDDYGNWLSFDVTVDGRSFLGPNDPTSRAVGGLAATCPYPAPDTAIGLTTTKGHC